MEEREGSFKVEQAGHHDIYEVGNFFFYFMILIFLIANISEFSW